MTGEVKNITDASGPSKAGHFFIADDVSSFSSPEIFKQRVDEVITISNRFLRSMEGRFISLEKSSSTLKQSAKQKEFR